AGDAEGKGRRTSEGGEDHPSSVTHPGNLRRRIPARWRNSRAPAQGPPPSNLTAERATDVPSAALPPPSAEAGAGGAGTTPPRRGPLTTVGSSSPGHPARADA